MAKSLLAFLLAFVALPALADFSGKVVTVSDGDTLGVLVGKGVRTVRLEGIDAPESDQPFGKVSRQFLAALTFKKNVAVRETGKDKYGRTLGFITVGGIDVNASMVKSGMAWWYRKYAPANAKLKAAEDHARSKRGGLWAAKAMPPWEWRHGGKVREFLEKARRKKG